MYPKIRLIMLGLRRDLEGKLDLGGIAFFTTLENIIEDKIEIDEIVITVAVLLAIVAFCILVNPTNSSVDDQKTPQVQLDHLVKT